MRPAWSVVGFTVLAGTAQGLALALVAAGALHEGGAALRAPGIALAMALALGGLAASFFHLGRPERAWRAAARWRTSWLSREVIVLPLFVLALAAWALQPGPAAAAAVALLALALFVCTAMIYICLPFLQAWATPWTLVNFVLQGLAPGLLCAALLASWRHRELQPLLALAALAATGLALGAAGLARWRNAGLQPRSTPQTAIGIRHPRIEQRSMGFTGRAFNTHEFFHGATPQTLAVRSLLGLGLGFALPIVLLSVSASRPVLAAALLAQLGGLLLERWTFFAEAEHPQNLYYRRMS